MKIGIATFQRTDNYGAVLQAYALQAFLVEQGHEVEIIDYWPLAPPPFLRRWLAVDPRNMLLKWQARRKERLFARFRAEQLTLSRPARSHPEELHDLRDRYDMVIAGSDQVWNPTWLEPLAGSDLFYPLAFAGDHTRRIAYAASFGHRSPETIPTAWRKIFRERLPAFEAISVREPSGVGLVHALCGREDAVPVGDPTLLLSADRYDALAQPPRAARPFVFVFALHGQEEAAWPSGWARAKALGLAVHGCRLHPAQWSPGNLTPSPGQWLGWIRQADLVVTNSFHGIIFCLLFHTPFIALAVKGEAATMNSRVAELLALVGLSNRFMDEDQASSAQPLDSIDWPGVDTALHGLRAKSQAFLGSINGLLRSSAETIS